MERLQEITENKRLRKELDEKIQEVKNLPPSRERGMTETNDDYFVDGVQWADEHPKKSWWRPVTEWPKDGEPILMKLDNGKYQYSEWEEDGNGFNEGFAEINFGSGAMMRLPITYKVVAWRPLADVINELSDHGVICTQE